ncbi:MAG: lysophospholipase [Holophagales bacterium]|nr:lysophospholipase [Holophagales bacterium]
MSPPSSEAAVEDDSRNPSGNLDSTDGTELFWRAHLPGGPPRALLFFVHGLGEHFGRYAFPVDHFRPLGFACYGFDLRGHGRSGGKRGHVGTFELYGRDLATALEHARQRHPATPAYLVGHSMGGVIALLYALDNADQLDGLVLSSPGLAARPQLEPATWLRALAHAASLLAPGLLFPTHIPAEHLSHDAEVVQAYLDDPLVTTKVSARWFTSYQAARREAFRRAGDLRTPLLLMQSADDLLVDPAATQSWAELAPPDLVSFYTWPGFYHEMFNEIDRRRVFDLMERWLEDHLGSWRR